MKVEFLRYSELPESQQETAKAICYYDFKTATYLMITDNSDRVILLESDSIEPCDAKFNRDLSWIKKAIEMAYRMGLEGR